MAYRLITCPETAHLEMIHDDPHPLGLLILACTRFRPSCAVDCARTCAARLDRRNQVEEDPTVDEDPEGKTGLEFPVELDHVREIELEFDLRPDTRSTTQSERPAARSAARLVASR